MDVWFDAAHAKFEVFFESKLELYGEAAAPFATRLAADSDACGAVLLGNMKPPLPSVFLDDVHRHMEVVYHPLDNGFDISCEDKQLLESQPAAAATTVDDNPFLYGELLPIGLRQLLQHRAVLSAFADAAETDASIGGTPSSVKTFADFGSGVGKLVFEASLLLCDDGGIYAATECPDQEASSPPSQEEPVGSSSSSSFVFAVGIELACTRHRIAEAAATAGGILASSSSALQKEPSDKVTGHQRRRCVLLNQSFLEPFSTRVTTETGAVVVVDDATVRVVFACALGFGDALVRQLLDRLLSMRRAHQCLRCAVLLLREFPFDHDVLQCGGAAIERITLATSWMDEAPAYVLTFR